MTWDKVFKDIKQKDYFKSLEVFWDKEYSSHVIYPERSKLFNAFNLTPLEKVKVVILGQDPYHEENQAMGLAFSVPENVKCPPSLVNIFKEIEIEYNPALYNPSGDLTYLATQGVLLLNTVLSVREHQPLSHDIPEYKKLIIDIFSVLDSLDQPIVFMLWGNNAKKFEKYITNKNHIIIEATHPSPLGANKGGWFNSNIFRNANKFLIESNVEPICWY